MREKLKQSKTSIISIILLLINVQIFAQTPLSGNTTGLLTKVNSPYLITGNVTIPDGQTLTIEAGVEIQSRDYRDQFNVYGTLISIGIATDSIKFTGFANSALSINSTHGGHIYFHLSSINSQLEYVSFDRWGDNDYHGDAIFINSSGVSIQNSKFKNSERFAIAISGSAISPTISNNKFSNNAVNDIIGYIHTFSKVELNDNAKIDIQAGSTNQKGALKKQGTNSYFNLASGASAITISTGDTLEIKAGVEIHSSNYTNQLSVNGTLIAKGIATDSIRFVGFANSTISTNSTHGGHIYFYPSSVNSQLDYVSFDRWGDNDYHGDAVFISTSSISISNSAFKNSEKYSIYINNSSISPTIFNNKFTNNLISDIVSQIHNCSKISDNVNAKITLLSTSTNQNGELKKQKAGSYFKLNSGSYHEISPNDTLTIKPGVIIKSYDYSDRINVYGTLISVGTAEDSIKFIGYQNETNVVSSHGGSLSFYNSSNKESQLKYTKFERWGDKESIGVAVSIHNSSVSITNSSIINSEKYGISLNNYPIFPLIKDNNFSNNQLSDIVGYIQTFSKVENNSNAKIDILGGNSSRSTILKKQNLNSYFHLGNEATAIAISQNDTLIIKPGVEIRSNDYRNGIGIAGTLIAIGTVTDSITFLGFPNPAIASNSSHGGYIYFTENSKNSILKYVKFDRWGDADYAGRVIDISTNSIRISNSEFINSEKNVIEIYNYMISPKIDSCKFTSNLGADIKTQIHTCSNFSNLINAKIIFDANSTRQSGVLHKQGAGTFYSFFTYSTGYGTVTISENDTIKIEPGVEIHSTDYRNQLRVEGTLFAKGIVSDSIKLKGFSNPSISASTHGGNIHFTSSSKGSELEYISMNNWGDINYFGELGAIYINSTGVKISKSTIINSEKSGIRIGGSNLKPIIENNNFKNNLNSISTPYSSCNNIKNNHNAIIKLWGSGGNGILYKQGLNSYFKLEQEPILIYAGDSLEIKPGVIVKSFTYQDYISVYGTLMAKGIESDSIKFIGFPNENIGIQYSSHGGIIRFFPESTNSVLEYVLMDKWGDINYWGNLGAIHVNSSGVRISKSTIINSESVGIKIASQNTFPTITNNKFSNNPKDIDAFADNCGGITANINAKIYLNQSSISSNAFLPFPGSNSNYVLNGSTNVPQNYTLTIEAGCLIDFGQNANEFTVDGTLRAIGTELSPIQLVRLQTPTNNTLGGRVYLSPNSTNSFISNVLFDKLGSAAYGYPALQINTNNFSISNITVSNSPHNGINYSATGSPRITASNFYNNKTGVYVTSGSPAFDKCNIYGNTDFGINNVSNSVTDTVDARNSYWGDMTGPYHPMLNPSGAGNTVSNKVKFDNWKQQPQNGQITDIGVSTILSPITDCNLTSTADIKVRVSNYGNASVSTFLISYKINNGNTISETVSGASLLPGRTFDYTFIAKANFSAVGTYDIIAFTNLSLDSLKTNDSARVSIENLPNVAAPSSLIPANGSVGHDITIALSWSAVANATGYDLYVWKTSEPVPTIPLASGINQITYTLPYGNLTYGTQYNWKVVAKRVSCRAESVVQSFTTRLLPDLIIESITAPSSATTETDIYVSFKIKNQGTGSTETVGWQDLVYLCDQPVLYTGVDNFFVTSVSNLSALSAGQSYQTQNYSFRLPQGIQGNYYVIVKTNVSQSLIESSTTNNQSFSIPINVTLAPPPDLQVTSVITSLQNAFSEDSLTITYKVRNLGTGPTTKSDWSDYIYLSQDEVLNQNSAGILYTFYRNQALAVNTEYTTIAKTKIPARISGTYYVHVFTDRFNNIFEFNKDNNNIGTGLPINVIQKPTPDLTANSVTFTIDSVSNNQPVTIQWATANDGAITAQPSWQENIYISNDAIFSEGADPVVGSLTRNIALNSLNSISGQQSINIPPALQEGNYYFFVKTDAGNSIYENPDEINNVSTVSSVMKVVNIDLRPIIFNTPVTAQSEQSIVVQWKVKNESRGNLINNTWNDRIYLSANNTFEGTDLLLGSVTSNQLLGKGGEYTKQISVTLPVGISGSYYLIFVTDADNNVFEKLENNNVSINAINITLAPWADLQVSNIIAPAIDTVGTSINIQYNLMNNGLGNITNKSWTDNIYLSPTNNLNETNITFIGSIAQIRSLSSSQSINQAASFTIPTLAAGQYYVLIKTDISNVIFENSDENNNSSVATITTVLRVIIVEPPQPIDLSVNGGQILSSTVTAGQSINIGWTVKNNSSTSTTAPKWKDAIYLSNNPILDNSDELLSTVTINNPLAAGATYTKTATVAIPQTASGTLYILVNTDKDNQNNDIARGNNTLPLNTGIGGQTIVITIPPPADLVPKSLTAPSQGTVAQPINVSFTIKNQGTGPTPSESWVDQLYLSTDLLLNGNDILIGSFPHISNQAAGTEYSITGQVFIPNGISGNYALMLKTDDADNVFERNNEANNIAFTNILINSQQPSDLSISEITVPTLEQYAGSNTTISWNIKNIGINAANGYKRDAVYFSKDSLIDASDLLFGIMDKSTFLPSQAIENNSLTKLLTNISVGEYYVILKTDILNNIVEVNENNNQTIAIGKLKVRVKELPIGSLTSDTLSNNTPLYYQLTIPQNLVNETLSITLKGDSALSATNRMYLSLNKVPDANKYEYSSTIPFKANQEIIVPALSAGVYYLTSLGNHPSQTKQPVTLFAKVIPFSISSINSNKGGDTGSVTVKIEGAKFEKGMVIRLFKQSNVYTATNVYYIDQSKLYATFNLNNAPIGIYTLSLQKSNISIAQLVDGFEVISGSSGGVDGGSNLFSCSIQNIGFDDNIQLDIVHPESVRRNQLVKITVAYANNGNVDIPVQTRMILSLEKAPINFSPDFTKDLRELILEFKESDGPPDILRAGAFGFINIYSKATAPLSFIITK